MSPLPFSWTGNRDALVLGRAGGFRFSPQCRVPQHARRAHMYVIGVSGKGKSKLLEYCLYQDIAAGRGCGLVDPHSQLVDDLLRLLLTRGVLDNRGILERIVYVDPSRQDAIVPFNVLATDDAPYKVATSVLEAFRRTWPDSLKEAPHFSNIMIHALLLLIRTGMTLVDLPRLLVDETFRQELLSGADDPKLTAFFCDRYDQWGREGAVMRESSLNKVTAFSVNPHLHLMLGQKENRLDFRALMDEGKILLLDLGRSDLETNRLIGSLVVTGLELAMRRRKEQALWNLTIDEFAGYVANEGSEMTFAHVLSEGRKFGLGMTVAHQTLSQLSSRIVGALSNVRTKVIFGIGRYDAEHFARIVGRVDTEAIKRDPKTDTQHELFSSLPEQWEQWVDSLRFQKPRQATVATHDERVLRVTTMPIPEYRTTEDQVEVLRKESLSRYGIPYREALQNVQARENARSSPLAVVPAYETISPNEGQGGPKSSRVATRANRKR